MNVHCNGRVSLNKMTNSSGIEARLRQLILDLWLHDPHGGVKTLEVLHRLFLNLDRADGGRGVSLWLKPAVGNVVLHANNLWRCAQGWYGKA